MPSKALEIHDNIFKRLELVRPIFYSCAHKVFVGLSINEIIAIKQILLIAENNMIPCWSREIFLHSRKHALGIALIIRRVFSHDIHVIVFQQLLVKLVHT